ncbi:hypothetical protein [Aestuariibacter salexigens]|uniref:hypothetical protein n=1 Tax=Aestuariibacter salexigens TaxID=226010 RepID=UPI0005583ED5|nr:hypothetical protein [Aestuariibacter salexigens]
MAFLLSWHLWDVWQGPVPGYQIWLWPANLSLVYLWHPWLTEEIALLPKLTLMLCSQFVMVTLLSAGVLELWSVLAKRRQKPERQ